MVAVHEIREIVRVHVYLHLLPALLESCAPCFLTPTLVFARFALRASDLLPDFPNLTDRCQWAGVPVVHVRLRYQDVSGQVRGRFAILYSLLPHVSSPCRLEAEFKKVDVNGGGIILFDEHLGCQLVK